MELKKLNCTSCGAPIAVSGDVEYINCAACGSYFYIQRGEGYISLKAIEKLTKAIQDSGLGTQDAIRENTKVTRSELQRMQLTNEISMAEMKLGNIQAEIRGLERTEKSKKNLKQLGSLHGLEYDQMEQIYRMRLNVDALGPQDLNARLRAAEHRLNWSINQNKALMQSNVSMFQKSRSMNDMSTRIRQLRAETSDLRIQVIKSNLQTFKTKNPPLENLADVQLFLQQLKEDEKSIKRMGLSPETMAVRRELSDCKKMAEGKWKQLENKHISGELSSSGITYDTNELASLKSHLSLVNSDIQRIKGMPQNSVTKEYERNLAQQQRELSKQITKLENEARKLEARAKKNAQYAEEQARKNAVNATKLAQKQSSAGAAVKTGLFAGLLLGLTAMFAGIGALMREIIASFSPSKQPTPEFHESPAPASTKHQEFYPPTAPAQQNRPPSEIPPASVQTESISIQQPSVGERASVSGAIPVEIKTSKAETKESPRIPIAAEDMVVVGPVKEQIISEGPNKPEFSPQSTTMEAKPYLGSIPPKTPGLEARSLGKGCLFSILLLAAFFVVGFVIYGVGFHNSGERLQQVGVGVFLLVFSIGIGFGSYIFIRNVAPRAHIKSFGKVKDIVFHNNPKRPGLNNPLAIKGLIGLAICLTVYAFFFSIMLILPQEATIPLFCIGVLLGPILAGLISNRSYLPGIQSEI